jgi:iron complex outermembrane receptor protein
MIRRLLSLAIILAQFTTLNAQNVIKGLVSDVSNNDAIIGATLIIKGTTEGVVTDWDGTFELRTDTPFPFDLEVSYIGYLTKVVNVDSDKRLEIGVEEDVVTIDGIEVKASRISDKQKESPLTIEAMDNIAIKETPAADFYDGLGALKGVDLTAASLGFKVVNTRGFNSTSPVRSLQIIDGVDNQAPGLSFSLGNFLGSSELDINKVELVVGASSAFYGPNAFNGVISMETKDPFFHDGLSAMVKVGERNMLKTAVRWADVLNNKEDHPFFAYKLNFEYLQADDWVANNFDPVDGTDISADNPGRVDGVNIYGDEYQRGNDFSELPLNDPTGILGVWHRTGYEEEDLVDYDTRNIKANAALHFRLFPSKREQSPELIVGTSYGSGTTVYQGDNRFSLKGITFLQNKVEFRKKNKFFLRAYSTQTTAGDSYDPYFTALQLQENSKENREWSIDYASYWQGNIVPQIQDSDYPKLSVEIGPNGEIITAFDVDGANQWQIDNNALLTQWHNESAAYADGGGQSGASQAVPYFAPGTDRFDAEVDKITGELRGQGGTKFFDQSALYHVHGEYVFTPTWMDKITVGSNARLYRPESKGTVFSDTTGNVITNSEIGFYTGLEKSLYENKIKLQGALRADKNQNFNWLLSPAGSIVYTPSPNNFFRASFSSAIRNPTLSDQYSLDVGRAILSGNLDGVQDLVTVESLGDFFASQNPADLDSFSIEGVKPEKVKTFEFGFRTTLFEKLYVDAGYYYSIYDDFLGFKIGVDLEYDIENGPLTIQEVQPYRYAANSNNRVTTQGLAIGLNYYLGKKYSVQGNYSWNKLNKTFADDPIIPAFNTPEHKFNLGFGARKLKVPFGPRKNDFAFNINYKWIKGFIFEGSPQFTGFIPTYDMLDAQVNYKFAELNTTLKIGASNLLNNKRFQTYGGPRIGRLAYVSLTYEPK